MCVCCAQLKFKLELLTDRIIVTDYTDETKGDVNDSAQWCNQLKWTLCVHAHLTSNTTLIILPSVNAALDVHNIEKVIFVLQCDIKYWFLKFTIWHIWYLHYDLSGYWELFFWKMMLASNQCAISTVHYSGDLMCALLKLPKAIML